MKYFTKIVALFVVVTSSTASSVNQKNTRATLDNPSVPINEEINIDVVNKIQLEDQAFWKRSLSMSNINEGDSSYVAVSKWYFLMFGLLNSYLGPRDDNIEMIFLSLWIISILDLL